MQQSFSPRRYRLVATNLLEFLPPVPQSIEETGLPYPLIQDLVLRRMFLTSSIQGTELAEALHLPYNGVIEVVINSLYKDKMLEFKGGQGYGRPYFDYLLTELGRERARDAFERCAYVGPAPVPLAMYANMVRGQCQEVPRVGRSDLEQAFHDMVLEPGFFDRLGPAVNSVRSLFLYGAPGNGKTSMAERIATILRGEIFVPYALEVDSQIIKVYDPLVHREVQPLPERSDLDGYGDALSPSLHDEEEEPELATLAAFDVLAHLSTQPGFDDDDGGRTVEASLPQRSSRQRLERTDGNQGKVLAVPPFDRRFILSHRPHIIVGGELTLEALDLTWSPTGRYYEAPNQLKACCGMLLIDDFGRQKVHPTDLLNRWIVPLEKKIDFLTLLTGKKFEVPFELLIIFSTNLDPAKLVDEAFLRRIRYKIEVGDPSERTFRGIFRKESQKQGVRFDPVVLDHVVHRFYLKAQRPFRGCHPRDILQLLVDQARFQQTEPVMSRHLMEQACESYFVHMEGDARTEARGVGASQGALTASAQPARPAPQRSPESLIDPPTPPAAGRIPKIESLF